MRLVFWNCGVAPVRGKGKRSIHDTTLAIDATFKAGVDLIALCEVDDCSLERMHSELTPGVAALVNLANREGSSRWDFGIFARVGSLGCEPMPPATGRDHGDLVKAAQSVRVWNGSGSFRLYLLHWRSRLQNAHSHRLAAAAALHGSIRDDLHSGNPVVVLGDFNDEPHDVSLTALNASRDPRRVLRDPSTFLYNPSWALACPSATEPWNGFGSFRHVGGRTSSRYLFDQALTSAHFLDEKSQVTPTVKLHSIAAGNASNDHIPLELTLPWKTQIPLKTQ